MRKLLFLSLVLICSASATDKTIACFTGEIPYFNAHGSDGFQRFKEFPSNHCGQQEVTRLCRRAYKNVSYAIDGAVAQVDLNGSSSKVAFEVFLCQEGYETAKKPDVSEGSWSDVLIGTENEFCHSIPEWIALADKSCGMPITNYTLGGQCASRNPRLVGSKDKYTEFAYVCGKTLNESSLHTYKKHFDRQQEYHEKRQMSILKEFSSAWDRLEEAKARGDNDTVAIIKVVELEWVRQEAHKANFEAHKELIVKHYVKAEEGMFEEDLGPIYSKQKSELVIQNRLKQFGVDRSALLFELASKIIADDLSSTLETEFVDELRAFDVENVTATLDDSHVVDVFPDFRKSLSEFWIDYCMDHTLGMSAKHLGFLNESSAHVKLLDHYKQIFKDGKVDEKFIHIEAVGEVLNFILSVIPFVFVFGAGFAVGFVVLLLMSRYKELREKRGKIAVSYNNFRNRVADDKGLLLRPEV